MKQYLAFLAAAALISGATQGAERQASLPLVGNGELSLTTADFEAYLERVPEKVRADFRSNLERVKPTVDSLWVYRVLGKKGADAGLEADPIVAARIAQARDMVLAEAYIQQQQKKVALPDFAARAREMYLARPDDFKTPELVRVQHILVSTSECRNSEQALARAKEIPDRVANADEKTFLAEVQKSSDDPSKQKNKGDLGLVTVGSFEAPFAEAVSKLKKKGEISEPVETKYGWHIVRFVAREPSKTKPFDEVKQSLVDAEKQKYLDAMRTAELNAVRADPRTRVNEENLQALAKAGKASEAEPARKP